MIYGQIVVAGQRMVICNCLKRHFVVTFVQQEWEVFERAGNVGVEIVPWK